MVRKCEAKRKNGTRCKNKALNTGFVCHLHETTRTVKKPEKVGLLFHIHFLYGLLKYGDPDFLKLDNPSSKGSWQHIAEKVFQNQVSNQVVQSHANRCSRWMSKHGYDTREDVVAAMTHETKHINRGKYAVFLPQMHMFLRFNQYTLVDMMHFFTVVMVNDIPYRMTVDCPVRVDEAFRSFNIDNTFTILQALDSYHINNKGLALRSTTACSELQQKCLASLALGEPVRSCHDMPLVAMDMDSYRSLVATCVDAVDDTNSPRQGFVSLVVDICTLIRNHNIVFPTVSEESSSFSQMLHKDDEVEEVLCFGDMPVLGDMPIVEDLCPSPSPSLDNSPPSPCFSLDNSPASPCPSPSPSMGTTEYLKTPIRRDFLSLPRRLRHRFSLSLQSVFKSLHKRRFNNLYPVNTIRK